MRTVSDLMKQVHQEPHHWWIKVVPNGFPNEDGKWLDCGWLYVPATTNWRRESAALEEYCPSDHHIVATHKGEVPPDV